MGTGHRPGKGGGVVTGDNYLVPDVPEAQYHADPALGSTDLKNILRSPAHYITAKGEPLDSPALRLGTLVHECILDPDLWSKRVTSPKFDRRTKAGKAEYAEWTARVDAEGLREVSVDDRALCEAMRESAMRAPLVRAVLEHAKDREVSCFWKDADTGVHCKARLDAHKPGLVMDLKTTQDASSGAFRNSVARFRYHVQAAHYSEGVRAVTGEWPDYAIVAIEKTPPYACAVYMLDEEALGVGALMREHALKVYAECCEKDEWPGYVQTTQVLTLPRWAAEGEW